ncbi:MAG: orotidine-5'-phosphate decarboxylase [Rickettsiales bacterium]|jgi:orotidine-5'-phosphate decarboxylase|nr:orotidine-5'-phosphate decarboxylase [Rickettsiales bacterium]
MKSHESPSNKLIVALDVENLHEAKKLINQLDEQVNFYKIGLELMMSKDYFHLIDFLYQKNKKIFADLKLYDIGNTVGRAVENLAKMPIDLLTIHIANRDIMKRACENKGNLKIIGVTVLTSLDNQDIMEMGFDKSLSVEELVIKKTALALECGLDGVVSSALEADKLRKNFGDDFVIVAPGIRLNQEDKPIRDDQKRVTTINQAIDSGASYFVVGRPITRSENPYEIAKLFQQQIISSVSNNY